MQTIALEGTFLAVVQGKYTSKKTGNVVGFSEVQVAFENVGVIVFSFKTLGRDFDWNSLQKLESGCPVECTLSISADRYNRNAPMVVLEGVRAS